MRKRSRLENLFPVDVHRADEDRDNYVLREEFDAEPNTSRQSIGKLEMNNSIKFSIHPYYDTSLYPLYPLDNLRTFRSNSLESNSHQNVMNSQGVMSHHFSWNIVFSECVQLRKYFCFQLNCRIWGAGRKHIYRKEPKMVKEQFDRRPLILCRHECRAVSFIQREIFDRSNRPR